MEFIEKDKTLHTTSKEKWKAKERHGGQHWVTATLARQAGDTRAEVGQLKLQKAHSIQLEKKGQIKHKTNKTAKIRSCTWISLRGLCAYPENWSFLFLSLSFFFLFFFFASLYLIKIFDFFFVFCCCCFFFLFLFFTKINLFRGTATRWI